MTIKNNDISLELRLYRLSSVVLLGILTSVASYIASSTIDVSAKLPAIELQLSILNKNLDAIQALPNTVHENSIRLQQVENRVDRIERKGG